MREVINLRWANSVYDLRSDYVLPAVGRRVAGGGRLCPRPLPQRCGGGSPGASPLVVAGHDGCGSSCRSSATVTDQRCLTCAEQATTRLSSGAGASSTAHHVTVAHAREPARLDLVRAGRLLGGARRAIAPVLLGARPDRARREQLHVVRLAVAQRVRPLRARWSKSIGRAG